MQGIVTLLSDAANAAVGSIQSAINGAMAQSDDYAKLRSLQENLKGIDDILVQGNGENSAIPIVFGKATLAGNLIWYYNLTATVVQSNGITAQNSFDSSFIEKFLDLGPAGASLFDAFGVGKPQSATFKSMYKLDFAIGICEGEIDELLEVCVNGQIIDLTKYTYSFYKGTQEQVADPIIAKDKNLSFKGLCYIVFEQFPISDFGTAMPKFTFTVQKNISKHNKSSINNLITGVTMIPASGEFVYDTTINTKYKIRGTRNGDVLLQDSKVVLNCNNNSKVADVLVSLDQLQSQLPRLEWVSVIVNWFADSIDAGTCSIYPAAEYNEYNMTTLPNEWSVAGKRRYTSRTVSKDSNENLRYGGTPSDNSVVALLQELQNRGLKVALTPMLMMDIEGKPWRGRLTGSASDVPNFFLKSNGYNSFILHYANLAKNLVDCFVIGTEMVGLTQINLQINNNNTFPAVDEFVSLANSVRTVMGQDVAITYAADWSEYHHTSNETLGGFYNMDKLWACENINFIGLDAYFPLTEKTSQPLVSEIEAGWSSGEGWDYYYNKDRTQIFPLSSEWAWKNIRWFIENEHINSDGTSTQWRPNMKKVWFMEYGFPSVDLCSNQPNVFHDKSSTESAFPRKSKGLVDFQTQSDAIIATESFISKNRDIIENNFVWTWDARPFPFFPVRTDVWSDCSNWKYGHWLNGKVMSCQVADLIEYLLIRAGIENYEIRNAAGIMNGVVLKGLVSYRTVLAWLLLLYNLRIFQENGKVVIDSMQSLTMIPISDGNILIDSTQEEILNFHSSSGITYSKVSLTFYDSENDCALTILHSTDDSKTEGSQYSLGVPFVLSQSTAENLARKVLVFLNSITTQTIKLPARNDFMKINTGNLLEFSNGTIGIVENFYFAENTITIQFTKMNGVFLDMVKNQIIVADGKVSVQTLEEILKIGYEIVDVNNFTNKGVLDGTFPLWFAFNNLPKSGISAYYSTQQNGDYIKIFNETTSSAMGKVIDGTDFDVETKTVDAINMMTIEVSGGELKSISNSEFFAFKNLCIIGDEIIAFRDVNLIGDGVYEISHLLRARFGTEIETITDGKRFVLLSGYMRQFDFPFDSSSLFFKFVYGGKAIDETESVEFIPQKLGITPWKVRNMQKTLQKNGDILFSWKEQIPVRSSYFTYSGTNTRAFSVILSSRIVPIDIIGVNYFLYTKSMQIDDGISEETQSTTVCDVFMV